MNKRMIYIAVVATLLAAVTMRHPAWAAMGISPLHEAVRDCDIERVRTLISDGADVDAGDKNGSSPLDYAVLVCEKKDIAELLLDNGADVEKRDIHESTPLSFAAGNKNEEIAKLLIVRGADVKAKDIGGYTPLHQAAIIREPNAAALLVEAGADVNAKDDHGSAPLHWSTMPDQFDVAVLLLDHGADVNAKNENGKTPLYEAAFFAALGKNDRVMKLLLDRGAALDPFTAALTGNAAFIKAYLDGKGDPNIRVPVGGVGPLISHAALGGNSEIIKMLAEHGADVNDTSGVIGTPLADSIAGGNKDAVLTLLELGADASLKGKDNQTPLQRASRENKPDEEIIALLLSRGAEMDIFAAVCMGKADLVEKFANSPGSLNVLGPLGYTPLYAAVECNRPEIVGLLIERGADTSAPGLNEDGVVRYPLHEAAQWGRSDLIKLLLDGGADANARDWMMMTPLHWAVMNGDQPSVELLLKHGADIYAEMESGQTPLEIAKNRAIEKLLIEHGVN